MDAFVKRVVVGLLCGGAEWLIIKEFGINGGLISLAVGLGFFGNV